MALAVVSCFAGLEDVRTDQASKRRKRQGVVRDLSDLHRGQALLEPPIWPLGLNLDNRILITAGKTSWKDRTSR